MSKTTGSGSKSVHKAIRLLRVLSTDMPEAGVRELARKIEMPKSTVHRLLAALEEEGLVEHDSRTNLYRLSFEIVALAGSALRNSDVRRVALPFMTELAARWNETVDLDVLRGAHIIIIEQIPGQHILNTGGTFAARLPAHCTSTGKVLLAYAGPEYVKAHLPEKLERYSDNTITSRDELLKELALIREQGYARAWGEYESFVHALGVPIRGRTGEVIAAMSVSGLAARIEGEMATEMIASLQRTATEISARVGYVDPSQH